MINYSAMAVSGDGGRSWLKSMNTTWPSSTRFAQASLVLDNTSDTVHNTY